MENKDELKVNLILSYSYLGILLLVLIIIKFRIGKGSKISNNNIRELIMVICLFRMGMFFVPIQKKYHDFLFSILLEGKIPNIFLSKKFLNENKTFIEKINPFLVYYSLNAQFLLEIFYCWEYLHLFKNPIDSSKKRKKKYKLFAIILFLLHCILPFFHLFKNGDDYINSWMYLPTVYTIFQVVFILIFFAVALFSDIIVKKKLSSPTMYNKSQIYVGIRHFIYIILSLLLQIILLIEIFFSKNIKDNQFIDLGLIILYFVLELVILLIRLKEIQLIPSCRAKKQSYLILDNINLINSNESPLNSEPESEQINRENLNDSNSKSYFFIENKNKETLSISDEIANSILIESIYYIIRGIMHIWQERENEILSVSQVTNRHFKEKNIYKYHLRNKMLVSIRKEKTDKNIIGNFCSQFSQNSVSLVEYCPEVFKNIHIIENISHSIILSSFNIQNNGDLLSKLSQSEGKSDSLFFFTYDNRFILKTIPERELASFLKNLIKPYHEILTQNNNSLLCKIYGVFTLNNGISKIHAILMENVSPIRSNLILYKFDLKGSSVGRETKNFIKDLNTKALKDNDFIELKNNLGKNLINLGKNDKNLICQTIREDTTRLKEANLMDYSLYIAICENNNENDYNTNKKIINPRVRISEDNKYIYFISILDFLTEYDFRKSIENSYKNFFLFGNKKNTISSVEPNLYQSRFYNFIKFKVL